MMATLRELVTELTFKVDKGMLKLAERMLGKVDDKLDNIGHSSSRAEKSMARLNSRMQGLKTAAVVGASAIAGVGVALTGMMFKTAMAFEKLQTILVTTEGSEKAAQKAMDWVSNFAQKTPFELEEVTQAFVRMRAYGLDPTNGSLATLGDASSAMGKNVMQGVEMLADAVTGEFERLKEFGIKGNKAGGMATFRFTDKQGIQQMRTVLANDRKAIETAILEIFSQKYDGAMVRQSKTLEGILSNLADTWARFQQRVMASGAFQAVKDDLMGILNTLNAMAADGRLDAYAERVGQALLAIYNLIKRTIEFIINNQEAIKFVAIVAAIIAAIPTFIELATVITTVVTAAVAFGEAFATAAAILTPIGAIIAGLNLPILAIVAALSLASAGVLAFITNMGGFRDKVLGIVDKVAGAFRVLGRTISGALGGAVRAIGAISNIRLPQLKLPGQTATSAMNAARRESGGGNRSFTNTANTTVNINGGSMTQGRARQLGESFASGSLRGFRAMEVFGV